MNFLLLGVTLALLGTSLWFYSKWSRLEKEHRVLKQKYRPILSLKDEINRRKEELVELENSIRELHKEEERERELA